MACKCFRITFNRLVSCKCIDFNGLSINLKLYDTARRMCVAPSKDYLIH